MPEISSKTPADRALASTTNLRTRINGDVELEPTNYFHNWHFNDINEDGDPDCLRVGIPEKPDGWWVYLSEVGSGPSTLSAQNDQPVPIHDVSYVSSQVWVGGRAPVSTSFAADISAPDAPGYQLITSTRAGFAAGTWWVTYTYNDIYARETWGAPAKSVVLLQGQGIRVSFPDVPEQGAGVNFYVGQDPNNLRFYGNYAVYGARYDTVLLKGFTSGPAAPSTDQTAAFDPRVPGISLISANTTLLPGTYTATAVAVDALGESRLSQASRTITITDPMPNTAIGLTPGYDANCVFDDEDPSDFVDASIRHKIFVTKDGEDFLAYDPSRGSPERTLAARDALSISGVTTENAQPQFTNRGVLDRIGFIPVNPADTDPLKQQNIFLSALATADKPLDSVTPEGLAVLAPGTYWFAVSYAVRGRESRASTPVQVTVPSGQMLRIIFPDTVNVIPDPNVFERDASGIPFSHVLTSGAGSATAHPTDGKIILDTLGSINTSTQTAPAHYVDFPIDRSLTYQIGATESVSVLSAGSFVEELLQYDEFSTLLSTTTLLTVTGTGTVKPLSSFGPSGAAWNQATVTARLQHRFSGGTVNGQATLSEFRAIPTDAIYRKYISPPKFIREPGQTDVPFSTAHPRYGAKIIGRPPTALSGAAPPSQLVDAFDFENGLLPGPWTLVNTNPTAISQAVATAGAIGGAFGWQLNKTLAQTGYCYLERTFTPSTRNTLAIRMKIRVRRLPVAGQATSIFFVRPVGGTVDETTVLAKVGYANYNNFGLNYQGFSTNGTFTTYTAAQIKVGDILDVELILQKTGNGGNINFAIGKNGQGRAFQGWKGQFDWTGWYPTTAQIGITQNIGASTPQFDFDDIVITDSGDSFSDSTSSPTLQPIEVPDRPFATPTTVEAEYDFEGGSIPVAFTQTRTPADSTTTLAVQTASAINGTYGLRAADTGTVTLANVYVQRTLASPRASLGARARFRIVGRPSSGEVQMLALVDNASNVLGAITIDSTGVLYCRPYNNGVAGTSVPIASGVVNGNIVHVDLISQSTGTTGGELQAWVAVGGSGLASARNLMFQKTSLNWGAAQVASVRAGGFSESAVASTWSFDVDSLLLTDAGETSFSENYSGGVINQAHIFLPRGTPVRDKWLLRGYREAVIAGLTYTAAIKARFKGVKNACRPCYFTAYDTQGNSYPLGSIFDNAFPAGVLGTAAWADYSKSFTIPSDCYEVRMDSKDVGEGEYVFQELAFCKGTTVTRPVTYATSGSGDFTLDTLAAEPLGFSYASLGRRWQSIGAITDTPPSTSADMQYSSRDANGNTITEFTSTPEDVTQARYADFSAALSGDGTDTPTLRRGSPFIRYAIANGRTQVATLLRYDRSEFPGGTIITELAVPYLKAPHGVRVLPSGRIARQRMGDPVGLLPSCTVGVFTEEAAREIQETGLDEDFYIETRDKLLRVRFAQPVEFDAPLEGSLARDDFGVWRLWAEAETGDAQILELVDFTIP